MKGSRFAQHKPWVVLLCALGIAAQANAASTKAKTLPSTITTEQGKTYNSVRLVSSHPDGLVIEYKPENGGLGMIALKFRNLPERLRQDFNYEEGAATEFENARHQALAEWRKNLSSQGSQEAATLEGDPANPPGEHRDSVAPEASPVNRFRAVGTIRGAMILDTVTGEAWLLDLHSVLKDSRDQRPFLQPKLMGPAQDTRAVVVIGP